MNYWFIGICVIYTLSLGIHLAKDGEPKEGTYSFITTLIAVVINVFILVMAIKTGF